MGQNDIFYRTDDALMSPSSLRVRVKILLLSTIFDQISKEG